MIIPSLILYISLLLYFGLLLVILVGMKKPDDDLIVPSPFVKFSIIIPARNEFHHIEKCIQSVLDNEYPPEHFEIIVINDHSDDGTQDVLKKFYGKIIVLNALEEGKKKAIEIGAKQAKNEAIITLDADCVVSKHWLLAWSQHITNEGPTISTGIVHVQNKMSFIGHYESMDTLNLMAVTNFGINNNLFLLGNGANLFFRRDFYLRSKTHEQYASGDDVFLLNKAQNEGQKISFNNQLKSAVYTDEQPSFGHLLSQRRRWSTKTRGYANTLLVLIQGLVFLVNLMVPVLIIFTLFYYSNNLLLNTIIFILTKFVIDLFYLSYLSYINKLKSINFFFITSFAINTFVYLFMSYYAVFPSKYQWKNRTVK